MNSDILKYHRDIEKSVESIDLHLGNKRIFIEFQRNLTIRRAVEREFEIIGEATKRIQTIQPDFKLIGLRKIINLRNLVAHSYDAVDEIALWNIIINHLPLLKKEIEEFLSN